MKRDLDEPHVISAKTLGGLAMPDFCPRCFWIAMTADSLPFQIFPGIFSTLDSYGKKLINGWFARHAELPAWLAALGSAQMVIPPPHYKKFSVVDEETSIVLRGTPDAIFKMRDGSHTILDYKTAKFTAHQDELFPMYEGQLNAYAFIGERRGLHPVGQLALVYTEPEAGDETDKDSNITRAGFRLDFSAHIVPVKIKPSLVAKLLRKAKAILDLTQPPPGRAGCSDCAAIQNLISLL